MFSTEIGLVSPPYVLTEDSPPEVNYEILNTKFLDDLARRQNREFYDVVAESYARERAWNPDNEWAIRSSLLKRVKPYLTVGDKVLVVGTGTGRDQDLLQEIGSVCYGIDLSSAMLAEAADRINDHLLRGDASLLAFKDGSFDFVYCEAAGEHMDENDLEMVLPEFKRVIKKNPSRKAHVLFSVRLGDGHTVRIYDTIESIARPKVFATYREEAVNEIFQDNNMGITEQRQALGGTPSVQRNFPWLDTILKINF